MNTTALTIPQLIQLIEDTAERANDPALRFHGETNAVLQGKLGCLEMIAESASLNLPEEFPALTQALSLAEAAIIRLQREFR